MNIEEKLKEKSYQETYHEFKVINLSDAIAICKEALIEQQRLCSEYFGAVKLGKISRYDDIPEPTWEN